MKGPILIDLWEGGRGELVSFFRSLVESLVRGG